MDAGLSTDTACTPRATISPLITTNNKDLQRTKPAGNHVVSFHLIRGEVKGKVAGRWIHRRTRPARCRSLPNNYSNTLPLNIIASRWRHQTLAVSEGESREVLLMDWRYFQLSASCVASVIHQCHHRGHKRGQHWPLNHLDAAPHRKSKRKLLHSLFETTFTKSH